MATYSLSNATDLFKIKYDKLSENAFNSANILLGRAKISNNFVGRRIELPVPLSYSGGVGSGSLPTANVGAYDMAEITAKKMYAVISVDREAIKAAETDEGAFVRLTKHSVQKGVESWTRNMSRALFNDGTGSLGVINANASGTAAAPVVVITAASWKEANFEEKDYVNCSTDSSVFEITAVTPSTRTVTLARISGSLDLTTGGSGLTIYMQNSKDNDPTGLGGVLSATSGSLYNVPVARRWKAFQKDAGAAGITADLLNEVMLGVEKQSGKVPNMIVTSYTQYRKILNFLEDQKQYQLDPRSSDLKGKISFRGVEFMSTMGPVGVFADRFMPDGEVWCLNDNFIEIHRRPGFGWFDDDGTIFLRSASSDDYSARYGGYLEMYAAPFAHGRLNNLST